MESCTDWRWDLLWGMLQLAVMKYKTWTCYKEAQSLIRRQN
jgi:hypothetical protein